MANEVKKETKKFKRPILNKIVNVFIGIVAFFLFLLIVFFGFSQTKTFRDILKDQITSRVNNSINGKINIESINGSILSSLILNNTTLVTDNDTLLKAQEVIVKSSPIHILLKRILIRDLIIRNVFLNLKQDSNGIWNYSKLSKQETKTKEPVAADTSGSTFPFSVQINNIDFRNLNFIKQTYENINSKKYYNHINSDDLRLSGIFLNAKVFANLSSNLVRVFLNNFSVNPNFSSFNLNKLSGAFEFTQDYAKVSNLSFITDSSDVKINAVIDKLNLLSNIDLKEFKDYPLNVNLTAKPFNFDDLSTFINAVDFLEGKSNLSFSAEGYFGDFNVKKLNLDYLNSHLELKGKVKNLHIPEKLFFDVELNNSKIVASEIHTLLKGLDIPNYKGVVLNNCNMEFKGEPTRFHAILNSDVNEGNLTIDTYMDLQPELMEYDIDFYTEDIDLGPIIGITTSIFGYGTIKGVGTDPKNMEANLDLFATSSLINDIDIDSLNLKSTVNSKIVNLNISSLINGANTFVEGTLDLTNNDHPIYSIYGETNNFNLQSFTNELSDSSNLNLSFSAEGENLEIDRLIGDFEIKLNPSYLRNLDLDETVIKLSLLKNDKLRNINLVSDFVDFNIDGQFSLEKAIDILVYEGITIADIISNKIYELNPIESTTDSIKTKNITESIPSIVNENLEFNYNFTFKDFELIALFLDNDELDISGSGEGVVKNDSLHFAISTDISIENLLNKKKNDIIYLSNVEANLNFSRDNREVSFNKIFGSITLEGEKIYTGIEIDDIEADFIFNQSKLFFNTSLSLGEDFNTNLEGIVITTPQTEQIKFHNILINYKNIPWTNYDTSLVVFSDSGVQLSNLILENGNTAINIDGQIHNDESHNFFVNIENLPGSVLSNYFLDNANKPLEANINLDLTSSGFLYNPTIKSDLHANDISYNNVNFGSLIGSFNHANYNSLIDIDFTSQSSVNNLPLLKIDGILPLKINYLETSELIDNDSEISLSLISNNFDIGSFGNLLPYIKNQSGLIDSRINVTGKFNDIKTKGYFEVPKGHFTYRDNNLDYSVILKANFIDQTIDIDKFSISNIGGSKYKGTINAYGKIELNEFPFSSIDIKAKGNLALLGKKSQTRQASIFGDLFIKTDDEWNFTYSDGRYKFDGNVIVDKADLVYASKKEKNAGKNERIIYEFVEDSSKINFNNMKFVRILDDTRKSERQIINEKKTRFDFKTKIIIDNIATFNFLIAPELNQKLRVETTGELEFESIGEETKTQGTLQLLDGSQLEFFKTFDAKGHIRFESDVTDPHLNIVATYIGEIENFENTNKTEEVAVKLKLNSPLSKLGENLSGDKGNLSVYVGRSHIENDIPDVRYDASNALTFVLLNQLSLDLNEEQKSTLGSFTENTAYSLLGSQLTSYLNSALGGIITNIRVNRYSGGDYYKFLFSGKYNNIRYSFGGNTEYLQLNKADIKLEYLLNPNFLIRLEQKSPVVEINPEDKIQELGLRYKFEF